MVPRAVSAKDCLVTCKQSYAGFLRPREAESEAAKPMGSRFHQGCNQPKCMEYVTDRNDDFVEDVNGYSII